MSVSEYFNYMEITINKSKQLKILIAYQYLSFKGGIEEVILNQSKYLKEKGYHIEILTSKFGPNEPLITQDGITIHRIPSFNLIYTLFGIPFAIPYLDPFNIIKIKNIIQKSDIVKIHGHPYFSSFIYTVISKALNKPIILTQHNTNIQSNSRIINFVYFLFDQTIGRFNLNAASKIIAVSNETRKYVETLTRDKHKIETIYNGVDIQKFNITGDKTLLRSKYRIPKDKFICLTVRRLTFKNGIEMFLNVAKRSDQDKTLFLLGGTGPDKSRIERYIASNKINNVRLLGFIRDEDLPSYYELSDLFLLPSIQGEGFPMVVLEAFSSGLPVVATKSGGQIEIIHNDKTGYMVNINDDIEMGNVINTYKQNPELLLSMSKNCREFIVDNLSWRQNIMKYISVLNTYN
jgi:glycosyltransferase involved in cell wall biosynthesis